MKSNALHIRCPSHSRIRLVASCGYFAIIPSGLTLHYYQVRILRIPSRDAAGPCWARHLAQSLWQVRLLCRLAVFHVVTWVVLQKGEDYFLQIDSHMRFRKGWDNYLRYQLERCESRSAKAILTCYPGGYKLPNDVSRDRRPTLLVPKE